MMILRAMVALMLIAIATGAHAADKPTKAQLTVVAYIRFVPAVIAPLARAQQAALVASRHDASEQVTLEGNQLTIIMR